MKISKNNDDVSLITIFSGLFIVVTYKFLANYNEIYYSIWDQRKLNWISIITTVAYTILSNFIFTSEVTDSDKNKIFLPVHIKFFGPFLFFFFIRVVLMVINEGFDSSQPFVPHAQVTAVKIVHSKYGGSNRITLQYNKTGKTKKIQTSFGIAAKYRDDKEHKVFTDSVKRGFLGVMYRK